MSLVERLRAAFLPSIWITVPYYGLQYFAIRPVTNVPRIFIDYWIGFQPLAVYPYLSLFVFLFLVGWLLPDRASYLSWLKGLVWIAAASHLVFFLWPNGLVRGVQASSVLHKMILDADQPRNAFPSLHASMTVFSTVMLIWFRVRWRWPLVCWSAIILWSTLAIRQHVALDIIGGGVLGLAIAVWMIKKMDYYPHD